MRMDVYNMIKCDVCLRQTREDLYTLEIKDNVYRGVQQGPYPCFHKSCFKEMSGEPLDKYLISGMSATEYFDYVGFPEW